MTWVCSSSGRASVTKLAPATRNTQVGQPAYLFPCTGGSMQSNAKPYHVYVLWSHGARRFYIGLTEDLAERLRQHNEGISRWTAGKGPWQIVWTREFPALGPARRFENLLRRQEGGTGFYRLTGLSPGCFGSRTYVKAKSMLSDPPAKPAP